ncbi:MAG TPA: PA2169 family four-helix-bundle protein [Pyrinomonadaceae bacterium]|nr:PA2169 family four-helix-bundle protein [Pyrinomonadaceae bacterium]
MADNEAAVSTLNDLIETCRDGQHGFQTAAGHVADAELKELFHGYSLQRAGFVGELQDEARRLGGEPAAEGSLAASLHRGWIDLKAAVTSGDRAVLEECGRGEEAALGAYRGALDSDLPASVRALVERQFSEIKKARDRVRALEDRRP